MQQHSDSGDGVLGDLPYLLSGIFMGHVGVVTATVRCCSGQPSVVPGRCVPAATAQQGALMTCPNMT